MASVASSYKIGYHKDKIEKYLKGEPIFPVTLEFDITSMCTRKCTDCPSSRSDFQHNLPLSSIENLFDSFEGQTKGLLMTGGETTMSPEFPIVTKMAKQKGFEEIAVVTNGSLLHKDHVIDTLLEDVSAIRISLYDWDDEACGDILPVLQKIEKLRNKVSESGSNLKIGVSVLTSKNRINKLIPVSEDIRNAGAHWVYYHPMCYGWNTGKLIQYDQENVLETIEEYRNRFMNGFKVFISKSRYKEQSLKFNKYHAAHFLMVVGADGINYLGAEVKYQNQFSLTNIFENWQKDFLQRKERLELINSINNDTYSALNSRHRGVLYNDFIEKLISGEMDLDNGLPGEEQADEFWFPHIL